MNADALLHVGAALAGVLTVVSVALAALLANAEDRIRAYEHRLEMKDAAIIHLQQQNALLHKALDRGGKETA